MELLKTEIDSVDVERTALTDIYIDFDYKENAYAIHFDEVTTGVLVGSCTDLGQVAHYRNDCDEPLEFYSAYLNCFEVKTALKAWLATPNSRYAPTPKQFIENLYDERAKLMKARPILPADSTRITGGAAFFFRPDGTTEKLGDVSKLTWGWTPNDDSDDSDDRDNFGFDHRKFDALVDDIVHQLFDGYDNISVEAHRNLKRMLEKGIEEVTGVSAYDAAVEDREAA